MHDLRITKDEELPNNIGSMMAEEAGVDAGDCWSDRHGR